MEGYKTVDALLYLFTIYKIGSNCALDTSRESKNNLKETYIAFKMNTKIEKNEKWLKYNIILMFCINTALIIFHQSYQWRSICMPFKLYILVTVTEILHIFQSADRMLFFSKFWTNLLRTMYSSLRCHVN